MSGSPRAPAPGGPRPEGPPPRAASADALPLVPLLLLFTGSGAAALVYEVVWIRQLSLTLSVTVYALTTVLCAFMAGLALGAALAGRLADRLERPLVAFGCAELLIAVCGLAVPGVLDGLAPAYVWLYEAFDGLGPGLHVARFALAFSVLLVPTTLMGTTLPFLSRAAIGRVDVAGSHAGALYAANTIGAVAGVVLAGFLLIPSAGLRATCAMAAAVNVSIGAASVAAGWRRRQRVASRRAEGAPARPSREAALAALAFGVSGFTAMGYEVLWTRSLEHFTHNSTYAYSAMLATFLAGLGLGSAALARRSDGIRRPLLAIGLVQLAIGASVVAALSLYARFESLVPAAAAALGGITSWPRAVALIFGEAGLTLLPTTLLFGAMFPLVAKTVVESAGAVGRSIGFAYVANTVGSILGALLVGFALLPAVGIRDAFATLVAANLAAAALLALSAAPGRTGLAVAGAAFAVSVLAFEWVPEHLLEDQFRRRFGTLRFYREEVTDTVMVTESPDGHRMIRYGDGRGTAGTWTVVEDRMYAHIPMLLHDDPKRVLQIGFGVGNTLASVATYPIEQVVCAELSPGVVDAAPFFESTNRGVLSDPVVTLVINDGRNFLLASRDHFDVIRLDPPELHTAGVVNLYTREFYQLARDHLAPGGIFSIWVNGVMTPIDGLRMIVATVADVFPHVSVWHGPLAYSWVINGSVEPHDPDLAQLAAKFALPEVRADLASIGIDDPYQFVSHFMFGDDFVEEFTAGAPVVTDDHTRLDFQAPRSEDSFFGIANVNSDYWLIQLIRPGANEDFATRIFLDKVGALSRFKRPVFPHLVNVDATGLAPEEVRRRIRPARPARPAPRGEG